jgi:hypothetical protein
MMDRAFMCVLFLFSSLAQVICECGGKLAPTDHDECTLTGSAQPRLSSGMDGGQAGRWRPEPVPDAL